MGGVSVVLESEMQGLGADSQSTKVLLVFPNVATAREHGAPIRHQLPGVLLASVSRLADVLAEYESSPDIYIVAIGDYPNSQRLMIAERLRKAGYFQSILFWARDASEKVEIIDGLFYNPVGLAIKVEELLP